MSGIHATGQSRRLLIGFRTAALAMFVFTIFNVYVVNRFVSVSLVLFLSLWMYSLAESRIRNVGGLLLAGWLVVPGAMYAALLVVTNLLPTFSVEERSSVSVVLAYAFVGPLAIGAGLLLARDARRRQLVAVVSVIAVSTAVAAIGERLLRRGFFPWNDLAARSPWADSSAALGGAWRGIVLTEHPLVLAGLLAASLPFVLAARRAYVALGGAAVLLIGIWATDSIGPLAVGAVYLCLHLARRGRGRPSAATRRVIALCTAAAGGAFLTMAWTIWQPVITPTGPLDASTQYRFALWSMMPIALERSPFGAGAGQVPQGVYVVDASPRNIDTAVTVDSELVLLVFEFGVIGLLVFGGLLALLVTRALRAETDTWTVMPALLLSIVGLFLAVHPWPSLGAFWLLLIGLALGSRPTRPRVRIRPD